MHERTNILGIDPGLTGGIALYSMTNRKLLFVKAMPPNPARRTLPLQPPLDLKAISRIIEPFSDTIRFAAIEGVHSMPGQGVASTYTFGLVTGMMYGVCTGLGLKTLTVQADVWKSALNLSNMKTKSIAMAKARFPKFESEFEGKGADGRAEAALIAEYVAMAFSWKG